MTARTDTARLLALIPYLRSHPGVAVTEVARVFGVSTDRVIAAVSYTHLTLPTKRIV